MSLRLEQVGVSLRGRKLLDAVDFEVAPGELVALVGPNGAGKTTLLRTMAGLIAPERGRVLLEGEDARRLSPRARAAKVSWLPQHMTLTEDLTALDVVLAARFRFDEPFSAAMGAARTVLERLGVGHLAARSVPTLSGGERQRVALAALLAQATPLLLLDEPANHLDPAQQLEVYRLLGELWRDGLGVVCVTHDVNLLRHLGEPARVRVAGVAAGRVRELGSFADEHLPDQLGDLFGVRMRAISTGDARIVVAEGLGT